MTTESGSTRIRLPKSMTDIVQRLNNVIESEIGADALTMDDFYAYERLAELVNMRYKNKNELPPKILETQLEHIKAALETAPMTKEAMARFLLQRS